MSEQKLTPWFPADVKPVHAGVYETKSECRSFQYWNGVMWGLCGFTPNQCYNHKHLSSVYQNPEWRGLLSPIPTNQPEEKLL